MSLRSKLQNIERRRWEDLRGAWLEHVPRFSRPGARPDPGLDRLVPLQEVPLPENKGRFPDVAGLRTNMLWEAVFLFHKCAHCHLAAQRLGHMGMHSWAMFNAYHSAYIGARGVMALLGIGLPTLPNGGQLLIDIFPPPETSKQTKRRLELRRFQEFLLVRLPPLDQRALWEAFQRALRISDADCWDARIREELLDVGHEAITAPRNRFLYKAQFWPREDLLADRAADEFTRLIGVELDTGHEGFLLRLSFNVYRLFEQLINDLAVVSGVVGAELTESRIVRDPDAAELLTYNAFLGHVQSRKQD